MQTFWNIVKDNTLLLIVLLPLLTLAVRWLFFSVIVPAFREGREVSIFGFTIGGKEMPNTPLTKNDSKYELYLSRKEIHWVPYNQAVSDRFWAAGTSLVGVAEREWVEKYCSKEIDIKLILPSIEEHYSSYQQLIQYDRFELVYDQVKAADQSYQLLYKKISKYRKPIDRFLRKYSGVMYANITILDRDAFIAFYDTTGVGDANITLHFNKGTNMEGYHMIEREFLRMWEADKDFGLVTRKKRGTSIIFFNDESKVLLFLRDDNHLIPFPNCWDLLGGQVEDFETPKECIIREIMEEIKVKLVEPELFRISDMSDRIEYTYWQGANFDLDKITLYEGQKLRWFSETEVRQLQNRDIAFNFKEIILDFYTEKSFPK